MTIIRRRTSTVADTERLRIRRFTAGDLRFIVALLNEPAWVRYIGDKHVRTRDDAQRYLQSGPLAMYERDGLGLYAVDLKDTGETIGMCGLIKREMLEDVDLGFAFLSRFWRSGYAYEAAAAVLSHGADVLGLRRIVAFVTSDNVASTRLLQKLGFRFEDKLRLEPNGQLLDVYAIAY
jgi:RimJ/RimL family protein N-acetyltransferase